MRPSGITAHMFGPVEGYRDDSAMLQESGLLPQMQDLVIRSATEVYSVYGDPAYPLEPHLMRPCATPNAKAYSAAGLVQPAV